MLPSITSGSNCKMKCCPGLSLKFQGRWDLSTSQLIGHLLPSNFDYLKMGVDVTVGTSSTVLMRSRPSLDLTLSELRFFPRTVHPRISSASQLIWSLLSFSFLHLRCLLIRFSMPLPLLRKLWLCLSRLLHVWVPVPRGLIRVPRPGRGVTPEGTVSSTLFSGIDINWCSDRSLCFGDIGRGNAFCIRKNCNFGTHKVSKMSLAGKDESFLSVVRSPVRSFPLAWCISLYLGMRNVICQ